MKRAHRSIKLITNEPEKGKLIAEAYLPYLKGTTDKMEMALKKHGLKLRLPPTRKSKTFYPEQKNEDQQRELDEVTANKINRRIDVRIEEHQDAV